jgi:SdpC family antimicrobial peptide
MWAKLSQADSIINDIAAKDPDYFAKFGDAVRSGNPFVVANTLDDVEPQLRAENVSLDPGRTDQAPGGYIDTSFQLNFNVHTNVNTFFNENVAVNVTVVKDSQSAPSTKRGFQRENMIADITAALRY